MNPQVWTFRTIDEDAFIERFRPRPNHLDPNASYDFGDGGCLFETYGPELDFVREGLNEGFRFNNPNERDKCGCGESFRV